MVKETHLRIRSDRKFKDKYIAYCKGNRYVFAKRVRAIMQMDMDGKIKIR